mmetsp:Transcript_12439/g.23459  ORF Transcript_12439/g.23459 Transcript_12439/m.23459 type:complete len:234 (+) Transcript_12439:106-807(+)
MAARDAGSLVAAAIRGACDAKAPRRTVAAVAAAAVSAALSADVARPAKQSQDPVPRRAPADSSVGDDPSLAGRMVRERRKAKRQRKRQAKAAACRKDAHDTIQHDMVDVAGGECGVAASPLRAVGPTAFDDDSLSAPTAVSPDAKRSRLDGEGAGRPASSSMRNSTVQLSGLRSTASVLEGIPEAWRNNVIGFVDSTPPKASLVDSRGRCMRVKPSTTPLPSEPVKTGKGRGC